jgi:small conductance mechanosensitive channel
MIMATLREFVEQWSFVSTISSAVNIIIYFILAWIVHRLAWRIAGMILYFYDFSIPSRLPPQLRRFAHTPTVSKTWLEVSEWLPVELKTPHHLHKQRQKTLRELAASATSLLAFSTAVVVSLHEFVHTDTIVWIVGLFGSAVAFAGRTFVGDFLAGLNIIFQDRVAVGEKVLIKAQLEKVEGVIEHVSLNATWLRATTGELYVIPNGEMRFICNFSRGIHSSANVTIRIAAADLDRALPLLQELGQEATRLLPGMKEPWKVVSGDGSIGQNTELTLVVKTHFGEAAGLRPQLLRLVQKRLSMADITLAD